MPKFTRLKQATRNSQRGVSTLVITMLLLLIITLVVLFSTSVGFVEQRTALNENRARIAEQTAEAGINMAGEFVKANRERIISKGANGWLDTVAGGAGWVTCAGTGATLGTAPHPCMSESDATRRAELWFFTTDGVGATRATTLVPADPGGLLTSVGGSSNFPAVVEIQAVLCRIDTTLPTPICKQAPTGGNRIAVTIISSATLTNENTTSIVKETWASFTSSAFSSAVPLVATGIIKGLGNSNIVANADAGGDGLAASMWSPNNVGFGTKSPAACADGSAVSGSGGVGSASTCHVEDYIFNTTVEPNNIKTDCASNGAGCQCPSVSGRYMSAHDGTFRGEGEDILDVDDNEGELPDITFFPGSNCNRDQLDSNTDGLDDSLFEWTFGVDVVTEGVNTSKNTASVRQTCSSADPTGLAGNPGQDCAVYALQNDLGATSTSCAALNALSTAASGLYYVTDVGGCTFANQIGSATQSVVVVVEQSADIRANFFGMLFVRSKNNTADVDIQGNNKIFGSMVVEGDIKVTGTIDIVYEDVSISSDPFTFPKSAKFARVPGSWLDATTGF